ncbi:MAG: copper resistance CopC family protein [Mycobacteriaceae bacterium]
MRKIVALLLVIIGVTIFGNGTAQAHSSVVAANPAAGSVLDHGPSQVFVTFNEALQTKFAAMTVVGPDGNIWSSGDPLIQGATLSVPVNELGPVGAYTINYRATSADGHTIAGSSTFTLTRAGNGSPGSPASANSASNSDSHGIDLPLWYFIIGGILLFGAGLVFMLRRVDGPK